LKAFQVTIVADESGKISGKVSALNAAAPAKTGTPAAPKPAPPKPAPPKPAPPKPAPPADVGNVTGDFTEADEPAAGNVTGDFTEAEPPAPKKPATQGADAPRSEKRADPNVTGDFTEADDGRPAVGMATGEFTEAESPPPPASPDETQASDADQGFEVDEKKPAPKPKAKKQRTEPAAEPLGDDIPEKLGGYEVLKVLGKGGMGAVLLGRQVSLDRKVALKVMHPRIAKNPGFVARFTREAYAAAQLTHHNVVQIYDIGEDRGQHFFSMEFVPGQSLMDLVKKEGKLAPEAAVGYILQAARGLRYGHNQGMVHRDIKPDNLMLNTEGIVKVADLGLVKLPSGDLPQQAGALPPSDDDEDGKTELTRVGAAMGTPAYMPPEQARDSAGVDQRADIYSLGCTLYVMITGRPPFDGKTALEIITKHRDQPLTPPEAVVKRVPKGLSDILMKMMAKKPEDRYQNMDEVIAALEGFLGVERAGGPFNPSEQEADELEKFVHQFNFKSKGKLKQLLALIFAVVCLVGVVGSALAGAPAVAGGFIGLMVMTPLAYFVIHGVMSGSVVFTRVRALVFGMRIFDWLMWAGGFLLFLATLYLFGLLWAWLGFAILAAFLGFALWVLTDRAQEKAQEAALDNARALFRALRMAGLDEDALRQFVCKFAGTNWEPFFESIFGYEAKLAARAYRKGNTGEVWKKAGTWREPVIGWLEARLEARRLAKERKFLQKVEAKALEAEGVSAKDAQQQAEAMAADMVEQKAEVATARKEGKEGDIVKAMFAKARENKRPKPGYNLAGVPLKNTRSKDFLNEWFGRRVRFLLGAVLFAAGLLWMNQNGLLKRENNIIEHLVEFDMTKAKAWLDAKDAKPLSVMSNSIEQVNSFAIPATGLLLMLAGACYYGWKSTVTALPGAVIAVLGPTLGVPEIGPLSAQMASLAIGAVLIVGVSWLVRK
jgi:serine/threonine protein kinase